MAGVLLGLRSPSSRSEGSDGSSSPSGSGKASEQPNETSEIKTTASATKVATCTGLSTAVVTSAAKDQTLTLPSPSAKELPTPPASHVEGTHELPPSSSSSSLKPGDPNIFKDSSRTACASAGAIGVDADDESDAAESKAGGSAVAVGQVNGSGLSSDQAPGEVDDEKCTETDRKGKTHEAAIQDTVHPGRAGSPLEPPSPPALLSGKCALSPLSAQSTDAPATTAPAGAKSVTASIATTAMTATTA